MTEWDRAADVEQIKQVVEAAVAASSDGDPLYGVLVSYGTPKLINTAPADFFIIGEIRGGAETAVFGGTGRTWNDTFTVETGIQVNRKGKVETEANARNMEILRAITRLLFAGDRLNRAPNPRPDTTIRGEVSDGPNPSCLDGVSTVSMSLLNIICSVAVRGA